MEKNTPISMSELKSKNKITKFLPFIAIVLVLLIEGGRLFYSSLNVETKSMNAKVITLKEVVIAYAPELKRIVFLNRLTGQVEFSLSDSVSMAIFALKSSELVSDYKQSLTNKDGSVIPKK